jgi:hypothetical protein
MGWGDTTTPAVVIITITNSGGTVVKVGEIVLGHSYDVGKTQSDVKKRLVDYSKKTADAYGNITVVSRAYSYNGSFDIRIPKEKSGLLDTLIAKYRAVACFYFADETNANKGAFIYGYESDFEVTYSTPEYLYATLQVEGLT